MLPVLLRLPRVLLLCFGFPVLSFRSWSNVVLFCFVCHISGRGTISFYFYSGPIPSFRFWSGRNNESYWCKIETGFLCGDGARVIRFFDRVIQQLGFWTLKIQANVDHSYVRRRAECNSIGPGLKHPSLRSDSSLAAKRRAEAVYSRMIRSHERRALGALLSLFSRSEPTSTDN